MTVLLFIKDSLGVEQGNELLAVLRGFTVHDERIFFYKDNLVLAHMGANSRRALILSNWFLGGR